MRHEYERKGKGPFQIPRRQRHGCHGARLEFQRVWGYEFPEDDDYIRAIVEERDHQRFRCAELILLMHERAGDDRLVRTGGANA